MATKTKIKVHCKFDQMEDPSRLKPHPRNPRMHPQAQIDILAKSIKATGWRRSATVSKRSGFLVAGHGAVEAAKVLGCLVPVTRQPFKSKEEEYSFMIADNRLAEISAWNDEELNALLKEIEDSVELTGFSMEQLQDTEASVPTPAPGEDRNLPVQHQCPKCGHTWAGKPS